MPLRVNTNITALNTRRQLLVNNGELSKRIERLASGLRINRAADDAAGLSVSEGMRAQISGLKQAARNAEHGVNLIQTAEGALNEVSAILIRMRELSVQSASSTINDTNRLALNSEVTQLVSEIDRIASSTSYNNTALLTGFGNAVCMNVMISTALDSATTGVTSTQISGSQSGTYTFVDTGADNLLTLGNGTVTQTISIGTILDGATVSTGTTALANFDRLGIVLNLNDAYTDGDLDGLSLLISEGTGGSFQIGPNDRATDRIELSIGDLRATGPKLNLGGLGVDSITSARSALAVLDLAVSTVSQQRGDLGAVQNRLGFTIRSINNTIENVQASESSIRDADVAEEVSGFTRAQILVQAGTALLAQANAIPQNALQLLQ
ncbi:MAG: flagellin [Candidatus Latescibacteria bacterium]|nr:flagellin [Candidatus Latescibacterota bacterium]